MVFTLHLNKQPKKYYFGFVALKQAPRLPFTPPAPYYNFGFVALALRHYFFKTVLTVCTSTSI